MVIMSENISPIPEEIKKKVISRRALLGIGAAIAFSGGLGVNAYTDHEVNSLEPQLAPSRGLESRSPTLMGEVSRKRAELYDQHDIPIQRIIGYSLIGLGAAGVLGDMANEHLIKPIRTERALFNNPEHEDDLSRS